MDTRITAFSLLALVAMGGASLAGQGQPVQADFEMEFGAIKLLSHSYRVGSEASGATNFDFVNQGGQEILFPFERLSAAVTFNSRHELGFLYQPLELMTEVDFPSAVRIDGKDFSGPTRMTYGFPFYRLTYQYRFLSNGKAWLAAGGAVQLRNASIRFESLAGAPSPKLAVSQNLGVVPALAFSGRTGLGGTWFAAFDATGIYASSALINGADFEFEGSILDASARVGFEFREGRDIFLNARFFGGTAAGISKYARVAWSVSDNPETENRIAAFALTLGMTMR
jgi:hypothetical protein